MRRILCLHLPNWPLQRLHAARRAGCAHQPPPISPTSALPPLILLFARDPRRGEIVVAASPAAHAAGVRLGQPLAEASALALHSKPAASARASPHQPAASPSALHSAPLIQPHDPAADRAALACLAEHCERFSPLVGWETAHSALTEAAPKSRSQTTWTLDPGTWNFLGPDYLLLDVTGIGVLFGGEENLSRAIIADLAKIGYEPRIAIAPTIGAAWAAARECSKLLTSDLRPLSPAPCLPPTAYCLLPTHSYPLTSLRLSPEPLALLAQLGLTQIDQVLALPRDSLRARFGEQLLLRIDQLLGTAQETIVPHRPPPEFSREQVLEYPQERPEVVAAIVRDLVRQLASELAARREGIVRLAGRLDCVPGRPLTFAVGLFRPSADEAHLWDLVRMQFEQLPLPGAVGRVRIDALLTAPLENRQGLLFAAAELEASRQLALFIDRCTSRLGPQAVLKPELTADPLPEKAVRYRPQASANGGRKLAEPTRKRKVQKSEVKNQKSKIKNQRSAPLNPEPRTLNPPPPLCRPLAVFSPPIAVNALSIAPDGPPLWFEWQDQRHEVSQHEGPERIEAGWWRGASVRRDYWRIETTTGERYWLFRELQTGHWHLHGQFG